MEFVLFIVLGIVFLVIAQSRAKNKAILRQAQLDAEQEQREREEEENLAFFESVVALQGQRTIVEIINDDGVPEFKYRFRANLTFDCPSTALRQHRAEKFIPRPNGNREAIAEPGGYWIGVSEWDKSEIINQYEEEPYKYIGGADVYITFLLAIREVYEDLSLSPAEKKAAIEALCKENPLIYTVRHSYIAPWESLLVPVFSLADGLGPHRISLLHAAGIKTISDARRLTDAEILKIKGIGKVALGSIRDLSAHWLYDADSEVIEKDVEYRRAVILGQELS